MGEIIFDEDVLEEISTRLDLRPPNKEAVASFAVAHSRYYDEEGASEAFECVIDSATGVGKTYIVAGCMEYLALARGCRNFAIITPGDTIRRKTIGNFTPGGKKSLISQLESAPCLITSDNFDSPAIKSILNDTGRVKVYVFTVQALTAPTTKQGRKTHEYQESFGSGFYEHLSNLDDLIVFADEHHSYFGPAFSKTIKNLKPNSIVGLSATPDPRSADQVIYRYPLAAAIADKYVKTPVLVARKDDKKDSLTKLADGIELLLYKEKALRAYCENAGIPSVNPVMLVICKDTADADEYADILRSEDFYEGKWGNSLLLVHFNLTGKKREEALEALAGIEEPESPVRIVISVGMLKEGWDVSNVYVIASMRASVSEVLTEQTLGRGLRLPFGSYTGVEMLDTLEVLAHERYEDLLKRKDVLSKSFIDRRTWLTVAVGHEGKKEVVVQTTTVDLPALFQPQEGSKEVSSGLESVEVRLAEAEDQTKDIKSVHTYAPRPDISPILVPLLRRTVSNARFSLTQIEDFAQFRELGRKLATDPETELRRTKLSAEISEGDDGIKRAEIVRAKAIDVVEAAATLLPLDTLRSQLVKTVLASATVEQRPEEVNALTPIIDAFFEGLGKDKETLLSAYEGRAAARFIALVQDEQRKQTQVATWDTKVELVPVGAVRTSSRQVDHDLVGPFVKGTVYGPWQRGLFQFDWFDSKPERDVANVLDSAEGVSSWVRLQRNDVPLEWTADGRQYNPDLIAVETSGAHWLIETKMDKDIDSAEVQAKRAAAVTWSNMVNASATVEDPWRYLLLSETDVKQAKGSWTAMKGFGS